MRLNTLSVATLSFGSLSPFTIALMMLGDSGNDRDENLVYDDDNPIWCETNDCERESCHRCFPRKHCGDHRKCWEQGA